MAASSWAHVFAVRSGELQTRTARAADLVAASDGAEADGHWTRDRQSYALQYANADSQPMNAASKSCSGVALGRQYYNFKGISRYLGVSIIYVLADFMFLFNWNCFRLGYVIYFGLYFLCPLFWKISFNNNKKYITVHIFQLRSL